MAMPPALAAALQKRLKNGPPTKKKKGDSADLAEDKAAGVKDGPAEDAAEKPKGNQPPWLAKKG